MAGPEIDFSGLEWAFGAFSPLDFVESEVDPVDHQPEHLSSAGWLSLGHIFAQSPQVAHRGLDDGVHVLGPLSEFGCLEFVLDVSALPFHGRQFLAHDVQNVRRCAEEVFGGLIDLAVEVCELPANLRRVAFAAMLFAELPSHRRPEAFQIARSQDRLLNLTDQHVNQPVLIDTVAAAAVWVVLAATTVGRAQVLGIMDALGDLVRAMHLTAAVGAVDEARKQVGIAIGLRMRAVRRPVLASPPLVHLGLHPIEQRGVDECLMGVLDNDPGLAGVIDGVRLSRRGKLNLTSVPFQNLPGGHAVVLALATFGPRVRACVIAVFEHRLDRRRVPRAAGRAGNALLV
ncbi:MAG: hypothetical protein WD875_00870 [Pirellulales bacterium]